MVQATDMLRVSEVYLSVQGEGLRVGLPTVFLRFGGCNLRCPGWPCDTQHAIDPKYRNEWKRHTVEELVQRVHNVSGANDEVVICYTGGEPFLQQRDSFRELAQQLTDMGYYQEAFTNGQLEWDRETKALVDVTMDWKLPGSGEATFDPIRISRNLPLLRKGDAIKFVCKDQDDLIEAISLWELYLRDRPEIEVFYGVAWGVLEPKNLIDWVLKEQLPWRLNLQTHNYVWDPQERGR